ncbi:hypothetical protein [Roseibium sp. Sym1]|uniref:hypothetical protein n=1 Tax=Roseibium sp. Sym1 TaxID=3016006 RepID=UPI0022B3D8E7|nr:hypothetical protein [Roseibium sp. Sym1]
MSLNLDRTFYSVICDLGKCLYTPETDLADMNLGRIIRDVQAGQLEDVRAVLEFNPAEGWCNDVTDDVLSAAFPEEDDAQETGWSDYGGERLDGRLTGVSVRVAA